MGRSGSGCAASSQVQGRADRARQRKEVTLGNSRLPVGNNQGGNIPDCQHYHKVLLQRSPMWFSPTPCGSPDIPFYASSPSSEKRSPRQTIQAVGRLRCNPPRNALQFALIHCSLTACVATPRDALQVGDAWQSRTRRALQRNALLKRGFATKCPFETKRAEMKQNAILAGRRWP